MVKKVCCPLDCFDGCSILAEVEKDVVIKLYGDKAHPITQGFLCKKGYKLLEKVYSDKRLKKPLIRIKNDFHEISWDEAFDIIVEKMDEVLKRYKSSALLYYSGDGYEGYIKRIERFFFDYLGGATYSVGSLCWGAGLLAQKMDFGNSLCHSPFDIFNSNWIVLWGRNALWTNLHLYNLIVKAKKKGKKVLVIDVYKSPTFKMADMGVVINPSSDSYLAYGAIKFILDNGAEDKEFINNCTIGFEKVKEVAKNLSYEDIEKETGVSKEVIQNIGKIYTQKPVSTFIGYGVQRYTNGVNSIRSIDYLVAISGNIGISGGGANYAHRFNKDVEDIFIDNKRSINKRFFNRAKLGEFLKTADNPPIDFIYISGGNPVSQSPDSDLVFKELRKRFVVNVDMFMTATGYASSIILPVDSFLEKEDIFIPNMWHDYIMISQKAIDSLHDTKSEVEIINQLAKRLNIDFPIKSESEWVDDVKKHLMKHLGIDFNSNIARGSKIEVAWNDRVFGTKSKKFEFESDEIGVAVPMKDGKRGFNNSLRLITIHSDKSLHSQSFFDLEPILYMNPSDANRLKLNNMDDVLVYNGCGSIIAKVQIKAEVNKGIVLMEEGYQNEQAETINSCIFAMTSELEAQAAYNSNYVFIKKVAK